MNKLCIIVGISCILGGCTYLDSLKNTKEFQAFCAWEPVAVSGIEAAVTESAKDPAKLKVSQAMANALIFLQIAAAQCP